MSCSENRISLSNLINRPSEHISKEEPTERELVYFILCDDQVEHYEAEMRVSEDVLPGLAEQITVLASSKLIL